MISILALVFACATPSADDTGAVPVDDPFTVELTEAPAVDDAVTAIMDAQGYVGVAVGIAQHDRIVYLGGFGWADRQAEIPVDPQQTSFRWASVSKGVAGLVAAQAADEGALDLDVAIEGLVPSYTVPDRWLPGDCEQNSCSEELPLDERAITLRQLLTHSAGVQHYSNGTTWPVPPADLVNDPEVNTGMAWALDYWKDAPLVHRPGTRFAYTTFGYNLAGVAIEESLDESFATLTADRVSDPTAMTTMQPDYEWIDIPNRTVGYALQGDEAVVQQLAPDVSWKLTGGGFTSTVEDFTRYCAGLNTGLLLEADVRDSELWRVQNPELDNYGLGFYVSDGAYGRKASHSGAQEKTRTALAAWPDDGLCITVMTNSEWAGPTALLDAVHLAWRSEAER